MQTTFWLKVKLAAAVVIVAAGAAAVSAEPA